MSRLLSVRRGFESTNHSNMGTPCILSQWCARAFCRSLFILFLQGIRVDERCAFLCLESPRRYSLNQQPRVVKLLKALYTSIIERFSAAVLCIVVGALLWLLESKNIYHFDTMFSARRHAEGSVVDVYRDDESMTTVLSDQSQLSSKRPSSIQSCRSASHASSLASSVYFYPNPYERPVRLWNVAIYWFALIHVNEILPE